jgi:hypothetical protein
MRKRLISPSPQAGTLHDEGWLDLDREAVWTGGPQKQSGYSHAGVCCMPLEVPSAVRLCCCSSTLVVAGEERSHFRRYKPEPVIQ